MIIGILNQKGGVGKTTLSLSAAHALTLLQPNNEVLLVDADPQRSSLAWSDARNEDLPFSIVGLAKKTLHRDLPQISKNYAHVVIDGAPRVTELARSCVMASDILVVPVQPSALDIWAAEETIELLKEATVYKDKLKYCFVINRKVVNTAIGRDVIDVLNTFDIKVLTSCISQRIIFAETVGEGQTVFDVDTHCKASKEIYSFINELLEWGNLNHG